MESLTKNRQSETTIREMIARAYGSDMVPAGGDWLAEMGYGWFNVAYKIRLRDERSVVLKIAPSPSLEVLAYERGAMATEIEALRLIRRHTDVRVPATDFYDPSHELCDADYFFMPYIDAGNLALVKDDLSPKCRDGCFEQLGRANRELNSIRGTAFGPLLGQGHPSWRSVFTGMIDDVLRDGERRSVELGWEYDEIRDLVRENEACLDEVVEPRFVEWDLWSGNVMVRDGAIVSIIDHERAFFGDPIIEAGFVSTQLPAFGDPVAFMRGYGKSPLNEGEQARRRLYSLHLVLVMVIETVYRGYTDPNQYTWARERLDQVMALFGCERANPGSPITP